VKRHPYQVEVHYVDVYGNAHAVTLRAVPAVDIREAMRAALELYKRPHNQARVVDARPSPRPRLEEI
jgi:hypothetical protein